MSAAARCDFCMAPDPEHVRVVESMPFKVGDTLTSGEWATCSDCWVDLMSGGYGHIFQRWMIHCGSETFADLTKRGVGVDPAGWKEVLDTLWRDAWKRRTGVREATVEDRAEMVANMEKFRQSHPRRVIE